MVGISTLRGLLFGAQDDDIGKWLCLFASEEVFKDVDCADGIYDETHSLGELLNDHILWKRLNILLNYIIRSGMWSGRLSWYNLPNKFKLQTEELYFIIQYTTFHTKIWLRAARVNFWSGFGFCSPIVYFYFITLRQLRIKKINLAKKNHELVKLKWSKINFKELGND